MFIRTLGLAIVTAALLPELAAAQAPPATKPKPAPTISPSQSGQCANPVPPATTGQADAEVPKPSGSNLSQKLAQSNGVLCPPEHVDPAMQRPAPPSSARMPVIKPPGTAGSGDQSVQPK